MSTRHIVLIVLCTCISRNVCPQLLNFTLVSEFRYQCGKDRCSILTQFCDDDGGNTKQCGYCNRDVCNSDPEDYSQCKVACDYQFGQKTKETIPSSTQLSQTSKSPSKNDGTTFPSVTGEGCCSNEDHNKILYICIPLATCLVLSLVCNVVQFVGPRKCVSKWRQRRQTNDALQQETESPQAIFASTNTVESGYRTNGNTPMLERKDETGNNSENNVKEVRNDGEGKTIVTTPQGPCSDKFDDGKFAPSGC